jgi:predicted transcriptional regulator
MLLRSGRRVISKSDFAITGWRRILELMSRSKLRAKSVAKRAPKAASAKAASAKAKAMTVRLSPELEQQLKVLHRVLKRPVNKLINEAVEGFVRQRTAEVESELAGLLAQLTAYKKRDPKFAGAFDRWASAEAMHGGDDPVEGVVVRTAKVGPTQTQVRNLLA